jgi:two-component system NtrC family response regulator
MEKLRILVVEDDKNFRDLLFEALTLLDYDVVVAPTAESALEIYEKQCFDCILTDITLGGITGIHFSKIIRKISLTIPIIAITGHADHKTIHKALNSGVNDYITKPIRINELPVIIERNLMEVPEFV